MSVRWSEATEFFEPDGALRDLYVFDVNEGDWFALLEHLGREYQTDFELNGEPAELPKHDAALFAMDGASRLLRVHRTDGGDSDVNIHFFAIDEIEMDLDPRSVHDQHSFDELIAFMSRAADAVGQPVVLTPENMPHRPLLAVFPGGRTQLSRALP